jgi:hypothetical protein
MRLEVDNVGTWDIIGTAVAVATGILPTTCHGPPFWMKNGPSLPHSELFNRETYSELKL